MYERFDMKLCLELVKAYNGKFSAALANNSETPGISPTRMEFHPSSSCASEILIRRGFSKIGKELLRLDLPALVPFVRSVVSKSLANELLITASMLGPPGECSIEIDIDYHATEVK